MISAQQNHKAAYLLSMRLPTERIFWQLLPAIIFLLVWQGLVSAQPRYEFFVGSPAGIVREAEIMWAGGEFLRHCGITALEAILGFGAGSVLGTGTGLTMWASHRLSEVARPYLIALGALPVFALGPVLIFWFGTGILSKVVLAILATFTVAATQAHTGACEADELLLRLTYALGGNRRTVFRKIIVPSSAIWVLSGVRINIGMALLGAFVGEFISSRAGLGHLIIRAEGLYNVNQIWIGTLAILAIALIFHSVTLPIERWARRWKATS